LAKNACIFLMNNEKMCFINEKERKESMDKTVTEYNMLEDKEM